MVVLVEGWDSTGSCDGLLPDTTYTVEVQARTGTSHASTSYPQQVRTQQTGTYDVIVLLLYYIKLRTFTNIAVVNDFFNKKQVVASDDL